MKTITPLLLTMVAVSLWISSPAVKAGELIYSQYSDGQSAYGPSLVWTANAVNSEVADDFDVVANVDGVYARGFAGVGTVNYQGVWIRFYAFGADNKPGALQREYFLAAGDPNVVFDGGEINATLSPTFAATGRHFLSVQPVINYWYSWSSSSGAPRGEAFYFRNNTAGEAWHHGDGFNTNVNADVEFSLYGTVTGAGAITSLSANTLPRSGFLEIFGTNFGGNGTVLIGGIAAPVSNWTSTRIVAYVPESAPLATLPVQVISDAGASNTVSLAVTARPPVADHVNWRFRMNGPYSSVRPAIAPDRTIYAIDVFDHLYALKPDGGLKWLVSGAGSKGVAVGLDGSIYVASESYIKAFNPDGSEKWTFVQNPRAFICLGVSVGPDGNIYSVGTEGPGVFSLTPSGTLRWARPEQYVRRIVDYAEILFGPNGATQQLYFAANNHLRAMRLDGSDAFEIPGWYGQPAIGPDGSVHSSFSAYSPNGSLLWTFQSPFPYNVFTPPDIGSNGIHYFVQNLSKLFALNSNGSQQWLNQVNGYVDGPIVDPFNTQLVMGSADTLDHAGFIISANTQNGQETWRVILPLEDPTVWNPGVGMFGFNQFPNTRARFTADGQAAYIHTATATGDNNTSKSFLYSLTTGNGAPPTPTPTPITISGTVSYCSNTVSIRVPNATLTVTGSMSGSTLSDLAGNYVFSSLPSGGNYTVTPTKAAQAPASAGINTVDVIAVQRHFINSGTPLAGCKVTAADVNGDTIINTPDVIAIQRFVLGLATGIANTGKYQFTPANRSYLNLSGNQTGQNYDVLIFGDVAGDSAERSESPSQTAAGDGRSVSALAALDPSVGEVAATVAVVALPEVAVDQLRTPKAFASGALSRVQSKSDFIAAVKTTAIAAKNKLVGFQGDLKFDERVVAFQSQAVQNAGTTGGNWNVSGNVLPGTGPIRTLRISAYSNDFTPLSGEGTLFELRMAKVSTGAQAAQLVWAEAPDQFFFIDADLRTQPALLSE